MRPRKKFMLFGATQEQQCILRIVMDCWGWAMLEASSLEDLLERGSQADAFVVFGIGKMAAEELEREIWQRYPWRGFLWLNARTVTGTKRTMADFKRELRGLIARKRGPCRGFKRPCISARNAAAKLAEAREAVVA